MGKYFKLEDIEKQIIPCKKGYRAKLIEDKINGVAFYKLEKTPELVEIEELKQKLQNTDYQAIKYAEGQMTTDEYEPIKAERQNWRDRINELENILLEVYNG